LHSEALVLHRLEWEELDCYDLLFPGSWFVGSGLYRMLLFVQYRSER